MNKIFKPVSKYNTRVKSVSKPENNESLRWLTKWVGVASELEFGARSFGCGERNGGNLYMLKRKVKKTPIEMQKLKIQNKTKLKTCEKGVGKKKQQIK